MRLRTGCGAFLLLLVALVPAMAQAQKPVAAVGSLKPSRILVKVRPELAGSIESALPLSTMTLGLNDATDPSLRGFFVRNRLSRVSPVFPAIVKIKKQQHLTDRQIANNLRARFPGRAKRLRGTFNPPEISRNYVADVASSSPEQRAIILMELRGDPNVEYAEEDQVRSVVSVPNDPYFSSSGTWGQAYDDLWGVKRVNAPAAWDTTTGVGVTVAVVDTGIDYNHPDIATNVWHNTAEIPGNGIDDDGDGYVDDVNGWNFSYGTSNVLDDFGHGTHVAGTIAAVGNNGIGVIGVAYGAKVMAVKALDSSGNGYDSTLGAAIHYAADHGADVINASWGGYGQSQTIDDAIDYANNLGVVFVAAAGNSGDDAWKYFPAGDPEVITVAASDPNDDLAYFSNRGSKIDVAAPGWDVLSLRAGGTSMGTPIDGLYTRAYGTSMAAPHVAGVAALIIAQHPQYTTEDVRQVLRVSATDVGDPGTDLSFGYGRLNALAAVNVTSVLQVKITSPANGTKVKQAIDVSGWIKGVGFQHYDLDYGLGDAPTSWTLVASGNMPPNGSIASFDPSTLQDGTYNLRLTAFDAFGHAFSDRVVVMVNQTYISYPVVPFAPTSATTFKSGMTIAIRGSAAGGAFQSFEIDWAHGINPADGYSTTGITLTGGGSAPVIDSPLGSWDSSGEVGPGYYTLRMRVHRATFTDENRTIVYLEPDLLSEEWPKWIDRGPYRADGLVPLDLLEGGSRLVMGAQRYNDFSATLWRFSPDGSVTEHVDVDGTGFYPPAVTDIDGIPGDEVITAGTDSMRVFRQDTTSYTLPAIASDELRMSAVVVDDLFGDAMKGPIAFGSRYDGGYHADLYAWKRSGEQINSAFPVPFAIDNLYGIIGNKTRLLSGDFDGDGTKEIVAAAETGVGSFTFKMFGVDGSEKGWHAPVFPGYAWALVGADLDDNGKLETIVAVKTTGSAEMLLHVLQPDGTERPGWPISLTVSDEWGLIYLAVGDLDNNGKPEIFAAYEKNLYAFNGDGGPFSPQWPVHLPPQTFSAGPVLIGDVDGDGKPDVVNVHTELSSVADPFFIYPWYYDHRLTAFRADGSQIKSWTLTGRDGYDDYVDPGISLGDFNKDGITDIAVAYEVTGTTRLENYVSSMPGVVEVLTTGGLYDPATMQWPFLYRDTRNTAVYRSCRTLPVISISDPVANANVFGTVDVTATVHGTCLITKAEFYIDGVLRSSDAAAPFDFSWDASAEALGPHTVMAIARDEAGNAGQSAPVTVNIVAPIPSYSVTVEPGTLWVAETGTGNFSINTAAHDGFTGNMILVCLDSNLGPIDPAHGVTCSLEMNSVAAGNTVIGTIAVGDNPDFPQYTFYIKSFVDVGGVATDIKLTPLTIHAADFGTSNFSPTGLQTITVGNSVQYELIFYVSDGFTLPIAVGCSNLGPGMTCAANPTSVGKYQPTTVTVTTTRGVTPLQTRTILVNGTAGGATHMAWNPQIKTTDYQITSPTSVVAVNAGLTQNLAVNLKGLNGFNKPVLLECGNLPSLVTCGFSTNNFVPSSTGTTVTVKFVANPGVASGAFNNVELRAKADGQVRLVPLTLSIKDFHFSLTPDYVSLPTAPAGQSSSKTSVLKFFAEQGFNSPVTASCVPPIPAGITCSISPNPVTPTSAGASSTMTLAANSSAASSVYNLLIRGSAGTLSHDQLMTFSSGGPNFIQAVTPILQNVVAGSSATYTVTYTPLGGMNLPITVSCGTLPAGATCTANPPTVTPGVTPLNQSIVTLQTTFGATPAANSTIAISGSGIGITRSNNVTLSVKDFSVAANTATVATNVGNNISDTILVKGLNGFTGNVALSCVIVGSPAGMGCTLSNPNPAATSTGTSVAATITSIASTTPAGSYPVQVTGTTAGGAKMASFTANIKDFTLVTGTSAITIPRPPAGQSSAVTVPVTLTALNSFSTSTSLSCTGQPAGITCAFSPASGIPTIGGLHSTLTVTSTSTVLPTTYHLQVKATAGTLTRLQALDVTDYGPNFTQVVSPSLQNVVVGSPAQYVVTYTPLGGMTQDISVGCGSLPLGVSCTPSPAVVTPGVTPLNQSVVTLQTTFATTPAANSTVAIIGSSAIGVTRSNNVTLSVKDFSVATNFPTVSTNVGSNISDTIVVKGLNGFSGNVALSCAIVGSPAGMGCNLSNSNPLASAAGASVFATVTSNTTSTPAGSYTVLVTGTTGAGAHTAQFTVNIKDFTLGVSPASQLAAHTGGPLNYTATLTALNGFATFATLSCVAPLPAGITCGFGPSNTASFSVIPTTLGVNANVRVSVANGVGINSYLLTVRAVSGVITRTQQITVNVTP